MNKTLEESENLKTSQNKGSDLKRLVIKKSVFLIWEYEIGFFGANILSIWEDKEKAEWVKKTLNDSQTKYKYRVQERKISL